MDGEDGMPAMTGDCVWIVGDGTPAVRLALAEEGGRGDGGVFPKVLDRVGFGRSEGGGGGGATLALNSLSDRTTAEAGAGGENAAGALRATSWS